MKSTSGRQDPFRVLIVDDEQGFCDLLAEALASWGYHAFATRSGVEGLGLVQHQLFEAALLDIRMPGMNGLDLLREIKRHDSTIEVVMITGYPEVGTAVEALKLGAFDYLTKPLDTARLQHVLAHLRKRRRLRQEVRSPRDRLGRRFTVKGLVGSSPQMERVKEIIASVAGTDTPILIEGESGTGKELAAAAIHGMSARGEGPFIPVNCSAIPGELLEPELFGHVRGAFTGAVADSLGLVRSATGGAIFLDEVAELPPALQVKLLRFLQDKEVRPVGSPRSYTVDVRIMAATNRNVEDCVKAGSLRPDLFYRLSVVRLLMPPLRERKEDIPALTAHMIRRFNQRFERDVKGIAPEAMSALMAYDFPGNVRELENILERAYALGAREEIRLADLPVLSPSALAAAPLGDLPTLAQAKRELILKALHAHPGDKEQAARAIGISRRTFYRRLKEYGLL
jgi:DNA-binding NtrC family response regulator